MNKICDICKKEIGEKEDYCCLKTYVGGIYKKRIFYHTKCFLERIKQKVSINSMAEKASHLLNKAAGMMGE